MKSEEEKYEANEAEKEVKKQMEEKRASSQIEYNLATWEEWKKYEGAWKPLREAWEKFEAPHMRALIERNIGIQLEEEMLLGKLRDSWKECPGCGTLTCRYQHFCSKKGCGVELPLDEWEV